ncbi:hypothetical protein IMSAGC008_02278 [Muribaculaceae bacterium]|nr:hypothetical protein IMSAGC008_02278 [Muribaculaceae bacterium]
MASKPMADIINATDINFPLPFCFAISPRSFYSIYIIHYRF